MIITDYSEQNLTPQKNSAFPLSEVITAGMIFVIPILFLLLVSAG